MSLLLLPNRIAIDLGRIDQRGGTPLHDASQCGHVRVVKCLLDFKADPNMKSRSTSIFMFACPHMYTVDNRGATPLHVACSFGHLEIVESLLDHNADPSIRGGSFILVSR
ncbi:ankyrin [Coprinellus micaceus]|uniref:Ankyrin n=1 Tax=Coprinellus micaceus TaxID=71717 RepID=A0A4Y7SXB9_COPMI|nr:ankyrin [Coprinellus micaceus]